MPKNNDSSMPGSVLITRFSALGDVAIAIPVIYDLCEAYPQTRFVVATQPWPATMFINPPKNLIVVPVELHKHTKFKGLIGAMRLGLALQRKYKCDAVADLHSVMRSWALDTTFALRGIRVARIDKGHKQKRKLRNQVGKRLVQLTTSHDRYRQVFEQLGFKWDDAFTTLPGIDKLTSRLIPEKQAGERWVALSPFSQHKGKEYPLVLMDQVIQTIAQWPDTRLFLMGGGKKEKLALRPYAKRFKNVTNMADMRHTFIDEFVLFNKCDVMLSMDSANMHLASLCGLRTISIWGATHPYAGFYGYRQDPADIIQLDLPCRPCSIYGQKRCHFHDMRCMMRIKPSVVTERIKDVLDKAQPAPSEPNDHKEEAKEA